MSVIYYNNCVIELVSVMTEQQKEQDMYFIVKNVVIVVNIETMIFNFIKTVTIDMSLIGKKCHNIRISDIFVTVINIEKMAFIFINTVTIDIF